MTYFFSYYDALNWIQLVVFGLIPAIFLLISNAVLIFTVRRTIRQRELLLKCRRLREGRYLCVSQLIYTWPGCLLTSNIVAYYDSIVLHLTKILVVRGGRYVIGGVYLIITHDLTWKMEILDAQLITSILYRLLAVYRNILLWIVSHVSR